MVDFSSIKEIEIPEGKVKSISRNGTILWKLDEGRLPSEYQEVEYIQSSGTQYINTNILLQNNIDFEMEYSVEVARSWETLFGSDNLGNGRLFLGVVDSGNINSNYFYIGGQSETFTNSYASLSLKAKASYSNKTLTIENANGTLTKNYNPTFFQATNYPIYLFALNRNGGATDFSYVKIYSALITQGNNILGNFVPCYRKSDNVIGMYDLVSNSFFTNQGSGSFTKGGDI